MALVRYAIATVFNALLAFTLASSATATTSRTYVSAVGSDENTCTISGPCRTFAQALTETSAGGEIIVLDSADYDAVTITQSVSILAEPGIYAGIHVSSGNGITVNGSGIKVILRGLTITGFGGSSGYGVYFQSGAALHMERCVVSTMGSRALNVTATSSKLFVTDTVFRNNFSGPTIDESATSAQAVFVRMESVNNTGRGINIEKGTATARDIIIANNGGYGIGIGAGVTFEVHHSTVRANYAGITVGGSGTKATIVGTSMTLNGDGLYVVDGAVAVMSNSSITWNSALGAYIAGGTLKSTGDNIIAENGTNVSGSITSLSKQ